MELDDFRRSAHGASPSLGQLLKHVGDVRKEATGDGGETLLRHHQVLDMSDVSLDNPRSLPFVLSFTNLTYNVKIRRKFSLSGMFTGQSNRLGAATLSEPVGGESVFTRIDTLLNDISGEAAKTIIGEEGHRRVSIGIDIVDDPIILFLHFNQN